MLVTLEEPQESHLLRASSVQGSQGSWDCSPSVMTHPGFVPRVFLFPLKLFLEMAQKGSLDWCLQREQSWGFSFCGGTAQHSPVPGGGYTLAEQSPGAVQARRQETASLTLSSLWAVALCLFVAQSGA